MDEAGIHQDELASDPRVRAADDGPRPMPHGSPREQLAWLFDQHGPQVYRFLLGMLGNRCEAEDALQSAFLELARRPRILTTLDSPAAYLFTAARHAALRQRKRSERRSQLETAAADFLEARHPESSDRSEVEELQQALLKLPIEQREVVVLKSFEGMTFQAIGQLLEVSPNTAASRFRYAVEKLRSLLADSNSAATGEVNHGP